MNNPISMDRIWGRGKPRPLFVLFLIWAILPSIAAALPGGEILACDRLGEITQSEIALFKHSQEHGGVPQKQALVPSPEDLETFSTLRILAASAETDPAGLLETPLARWGLWRLCTGEAYSRYMEEIFTPGQNPSPEEIEKYYQDHQKDFEEKGHIRFRSIFLDTTRCTDTACHTGLEKKAGQILAALVSGASAPTTVPLDLFLKVASEFTSQPTSAFEVRGPFPLGQISPVLEKAALSLEPGQVGPVIPTKHGFQILRLESKAVPGVHPLEEVRARIRQTLRVHETQTRRKEFIDRMLDSGKLAVSEEGLTALIKSATQPQETAPVLLSSAFKGGLTVGRYLDYMMAMSMTLRPPGDPDEKVKAFHRDTIQRFLLVPDLTFQEAQAAGLTSDTTFQERIKVGRILFLGNLFLNHLVAARLEKQPQITPEEIKAYYDSHPSEFMSPEEYRLCEIAAHPNSATSPSTLEFAYREAEQKVLKAMAEIQEGTPEEQIIQQMSQGTEAAPGGVTGWLLSGTRYPLEIWKALSGTPTGAWCGQVFRFGSLVVGLKVEDRKASQGRPIEECTLEIHEKIHNQRRTAQEEQLKQEIRKTSGLTRH